MWPEITAFRFNSASKMFGGQASPDPPVQLTWNVLDVTDTLDVSNFVHPSRLPF